MFPSSLAHRRIKNAIIGNQTKKSSFMLLGVIPRLVEWERGNGEVGERVGGRRETKMEGGGGGKKRGKEKVFSVVHIHVQVLLLGHLQNIVTLPSSHPFLSHLFLLLTLLFTIPPSPLPSSQTGDSDRRGAIGYRPRL